MQELTATETIEVLTSRAQGHGLPHGYGGVPHPVEIEAILDV